MTTKTADKPTEAPPAPALKFQFEDVEVPALVRGGTLPNPFTGIVATMTVGGKAKSGPVPYLDTPEETGKRAQNRVRRQLDDLGDARGCTIRANFTDPEKGPHKVTFWLVEKIERKGAEETPATEAPAS